MVDEVKPKCETAAVPAPDGDQAVGLGAMFEVLAAGLFTDEFPSQLVGAAEQDPQALVER